ncbi:MAG: HAD family hydrolase [Rhodospirillales bacterium]|nr:HAD family hydrolase [Rhodospirillales bacterium]
MSVIKLPDSAKLDHEGIWCQTINRPDRNLEWTKGKAALFLDRDGVMVEEVHYLSRPEDTHLIKGSGELIAACNKSDIPVIVVTNQSGIARGYFEWGDFAIVQQKMLDDLKYFEAAVDAVYACPHHKKGNPPYNIDNHPARKPNPGMLLRAEETLKVDLSTSWIIGDKAGDLGAGKNAGLAGGIHVLTGHGRDEGEAEKSQALDSSDFKATSASDISACTELLPFFETAIR